MGARSFYHKVEATSPREAFESLCETAVYERGHDYYNGTISNCALGRCRKTFDKPTKANLAAADKIIQMYGGGEKCVADYIDLGLDHYIEVSVKKQNKPYSAKFKSMYGVYRACTNTLVAPNARFETKPEADAYAIKNYALKGIDVEVKKRPVKISGNEVTTTFETIVKKVKSPKKNTETKQYKAVHTYIFYGFAAE